MRCYCTGFIMVSAPILDNKYLFGRSVFEPTALLREARRQKRLDDLPAPSVCILDPDGDVVRGLRQRGDAAPMEAWACYHTELDKFELGGRDVGIVGRAVGAPFAVLVAEELFASGCRFLISLTSAGQVTPAGAPPYFVVIDRAVRDEGTSYHYAPPDDYAEASPDLIEMAIKALAGMDVRVGASWTTDAPFRETAEAIDAMRKKGVLAVEMEAAALYTFARVRKQRVLCLAHVTNTMGLSGDDFEKGEADGVADALRVLEAIVQIMPEFSSSPAS